MLMATSVHIPKAVLEAVDHRARQLKMSRNRYIVRSLEKEIAHESEWSEGFFDELRRGTEQDAAAVDEILKAIASRRSSKKAPAL